MDDLKDYIQNTLTVSPDFQLLLTSKAAIQLKFDALSDGQQVYLYDKSKIRDHQPSEDDFSGIALPGSAPSESNSLQELFKLRSEWAQEYLSIFQSIEPKCKQISEQLSVMRGGVVTARLHMENQSKVLETSFQSRLEFALALDSDLSEMANWRQSVENLKCIKVPQSVGGGTLYRFVDVEVLEQTASIMERKRDLTNKKMKSLATDVTNIVNQTVEVSQLADELTNAKKSTVSSNLTAITDIFQDLEAIVYKIKRDADYVGSMQNSVSNERSMSRILALHDKEFCPQVKNLGEEIADLYKQLVKEKNSVQNQSIIFLRKISQLQYQTSLVKPKIQQLSQELHDIEENRVVIGRAIDIPFLFGIFMIELARRTKFDTELRTTVSNDAEIMAIHVQDEEKRRTKFKKQYNGFNLLEINDDDVPSVDIAIRTSSKIDDDTKDNNRRNDIVGQVYLDDLNKYLDTIKDCELVEEHQELVTEMQQKLQIPKLGSKMKAFKSIPVSESFMSSGNSHAVDDSKIRGYESRIRKLEDLLHREQYKNLEACPSSSLDNAPPSRFIQTVHSLEEQRAKDKETITRLEKEAEKLRENSNTDEKGIDATTTATTDEMEELRKALENLTQESSDKLELAEQMKSDLLANMTAKEAEFNSERKSLLEEISELRERVEEFEDHTIDSEDDFAKLQTELVESKAKGDRLETIIEDLKKQLLDNNRENLHLKQFKEKLDIRSRDLSQRLYTSYKRSCELLESMGLQASKEVDGTSITFLVNRVRGLGRRRSSTKTSEQLRESSGLLLDSEEADSDKKESTIPTDLLYWMEDSEDDEERYTRFMNEVYIDYDIFKDSVVQRFRDMEHLARKLQREVRLNRDKNHKSQDEGKFKISLRNFKEGDLVLFLPTRDPTRIPNPWAAFNIGAPHYFLKQADEHKLETREYLVARITKIEDRIVNKVTDTEEDNPFDLSDGLKWHLLDAKPEW